MRTIFITIILTLLNSFTVHAEEETPNAKQARRIFNSAYNLVFGKEGSTLNYDVNIVGIYKTKGKIWIKDKKQKFEDKRVISWNDGSIVHMAYKKKKVVEIHDPHSNDRDKHSGKFKFDLEDFNYNIYNDPQGFLLILKQKKKAKGTIKEVRAIVDKRTYAPIKIRIKVMFFWTTIHISNFEAGNIDDMIFEFPASQYTSGWKYQDKRK